jgi:hypothetical protein
MNSNFKSLLWLIAAGAAIYVGLRMTKQRELDALQQEYISVTAQAATLARDIPLMKEKLLTAQAESATAGDFEAKQNASLASIVAEQKKIEELLARWPEVEAARAAAVQDVRKREFSRPPVTVTLTDGTKMEKFVVRGVPSETVVAAEHASGLLKLPADKLPAEIRERLALGWQPEPPPRMTVDKDGNVVIKRVERPADPGAAGSGDDLANVEKDSTTLSGVTRALASNGAALAKAEKSFENERIYLRKLGIFKSDVREGSSGKSYGQLKKDANARLIALAKTIQKLRAEKGALEVKLKGF